MTVEDQLAEVLHERADRPVDAEALLSATLLAGRARRRRRHGTWAAAAAVLAGLATVAALLPYGGGTAVVTDDPPAGWDTMPALVPAAGEPGAATRPDLVGTDPQVLRFAVPWTPFPVRGVTWQSDAGVEKIDVSMSVENIDVSGQVLLWRGQNLGEFDNTAVPNTDTPTVVDGHPAVLSREQFTAGPNQWLTWHPADGLTAQVSLVATGGLVAEGTEPPSLASAVSVDDLEAFANAVRLDSTTACSAPLRLTFVPPGARLEDCYGTISSTERGEPIRAGALRLAVGQRALLVEYGRLVDDKAPALAPSPDLSESGPTASAPTDSREPSPTATATADPGAASIVESATRILGPDLWASVGSAPGDGSMRAQVLAGIAKAGDLVDPSSWPPRSLA
ncbi:hypothetical protein [Asanoa siamensis]|uniref:DUF4179 domain-containing protein n=1 Tax=Asanoa siamensis TaxID=926357 RepID=A0ABQ4D159_9ACTN|nr:hypothetical protein [Asanoa siamensis]GIF77261.1 hypothetical protein Asi02nite_67790 [Asanoa siamensis]